MTVPYAAIQRVTDDVERLNQMLLLCRGRGRVSLAQLSSARDVVADALALMKIAHLPSTDTPEPMQTPDPVVIDLTRQERLKGIVVFLAYHATDDNWEGDTYADLHTALNHSASVYARGEWSHLWAKDGPDWQEVDDAQAFAAVPAGALVWRPSVPWKGMWELLCQGQDTQIRVRSTRIYTSAPRLA